MAHIKTIELADGNKAYRLFFYLNNRQMSKYFPPPIKRKEVDAFKIELERNIKLYKAEFIEFDKLLEFLGIRQKTSKLTLNQFSKLVLQERLKNVSHSTIKRNRSALKTLTRILGGNFLITDLSRKHIEYFKQKRLEEGVSREGINRDSANIRACFRSGYYLEITDKNLFPTPKHPRDRIFFKTDKQVPKALAEHQLNAISSYLKQNDSYHAWLTFNIIRYTGARRCEICQRPGEGDSGLYWDAINFDLKVITLKGKKKKRNVPIDPVLRQILLKNRGVGLVIHYKADTITRKFKKAMRAVGINLEKEAVHILRKSAASHWLEEGFNLKEVQEMLGHESIETTEIYLSINNQVLQKKMASLGH